MQHHVFAVWDFMSLLKALQHRLCSVTVPWLPAESSEACRLVNEIVLAEESDTDGHGGFASHFELYQRAMRRFGAATAPIDSLLARLRAGDPLATASDRAELAEPIRRFVSHTFAVIDSGDLSRIAATFTFGREDLLPDVFQRIVDRLARQGAGGWTSFNTISCGTSSWTATSTAPCRPDWSAACAATTRSGGKPPKSRHWPRSMPGCSSGTPSTPPSDPPGADVRSRPQKH